MFYLVLNMESYSGYRGIGRVEWNDPMMREREIKEISIVSTTMFIIK